ncbi:hypothetical protein KC356_g166 [Hortaea werneckii]|nr:hypothetical protein KC356_g166 [Hortaea werneckii]
MANQQKRMLTSDKSKLKDVKISDLSNVLATPAAWTALPLPVRQHLYTLLPPPEPHEPAHDPEINPMQTAYRPSGGMTRCERARNGWRGSGRGRGKGGRGWEGRGRGNGGREG